MTASVLSGLCCMVSIHYCLLDLFSYDTQNLSATCKPTYFTFPQGFRLFLGLGHE